MAVCGELFLEQLFKNSSSQPLFAMYPTRPPHLSLAMPLNSWESRPCTPYVLAVASCSLHKQVPR